MKRSSLSWLVPILLLAACGRDLALPIEPDAPPAPVPLSVEPSPGLAAPGETITLAIVGGEEPFALVGPEPLPVEAPATLPSNAVVLLEGRTLTYTAPAAGDFDDEVALVDAAGAGVTARIRVGAILRIVPGYSIANASGRTDLEAVGGKAPYEFAVLDDAAAAAGAASSWLPEDATACAGGATAPVASQTGGGRLLLASSAGRSTVTVTDSTGATDSATIVRGLALRVIPADVDLAPGEEQTFELLGGDPPYVLTLDGPGAVALPLTVEGSAALPPGLSWTGSGLVVAPEFGADGAAGELLFTITVRDWSALAPCPRTDDAAREVKALVRIVVPPRPAALALDAPPSLAAGRSRLLTATGGVPPYSFGFEPRRNFSGGTLDAGGAYTAGPNVNVADEVHVVDAAGSLVALPIFVSAGGVPASEWRAGLEPLADADLCHPEAVGRTIFAGGLRFRLGADGDLEVGPGAPGALSQVTDFNDDGLPDALVRLGGADGGRFHLYVGTPGGDLVWVGGGIETRAAAIVQTTIRHFLPQGGMEFVPGPRWVLLAGALDAAGQECDLAIVPLGDLLAGLPPAGCVLAYDPAAFVPEPFLLPTGTGLFALARRGIELFQLSYRGDVAALTGGDGLPLACPGTPGDEGYRSPVAADLDGSGIVDVARVVRSQGGAWVVDACVVDGTQLAAGHRTELSGPNEPALFVGARRPGAHDELFVGPTLAARGDDASAVILADGFAGPGLATSRLPVPPGMLVGSGDLDGDGFVDLVSIGDLDALLLHRGDPDGGLNRSIRVRLGPPGRYEILAAQLDADGREDLVASTSGHVRLLGGASVPSIPGDPSSPPLPALVTLDDDGTLQALASVLDADGDGDADLLGVDGSLELRLLTTDGTTGIFDGELAVDVPLEQGGGRPRGAVLLPGGPQQVIVPRLREQAALDGLELLAVDPVSGALELQRTVSLTTAAGDGDHGLIGDADGDGIADLVAGSTCGSPCAGTRIEGLFLWRGRDEGGLWTLEPEPTQLAGPLEVPPGFLALAGEQPLLLVDAGRGLVLRLLGNVRSELPGELRTFLLLDSVPTGGAAGSGSRIVDAGALSPTVQGAHVALRDLDGDGSAELLTGASTTPGGAPNVLAVLSLDAAGLPLPGELRCSILAPAGVTASWQPLDVLGDGVPELAVTLSPPGQSSAPEVVLLQSSWLPLDGSMDPFGCGGRPFAP